jgi:non-ribosomal peptide synthetase component F
MSAWNWNGTSCVPPVTDALIHKQFQKQVEEQPDREAVCAWDGSLTYSELDWLSSALAGFLHGNGTPALVVFTSGSTVTPKGIVQEHRGYCSAAAYHGTALSYGKESRIFQFAAHTFDVSLCDIVTTLIHGGCICIPSDEERMNDLSGAIKRLRANHLPFTPTVATMIWPDDVLPEVKWMTLGGEALSREAMNIWADHVNLIQAYGPAEAGVDCTVRQNVKEEDSPNTLGRPIASSIWIVNPEDHNHLVPIGTEGELLIEGPIVARGYLSTMP